MSSFKDFTRQFSALAWKNAKLKFRNPGTLLLELVIPTVAIIMLGVLGAAIIPPESYDKSIPSTYSPIPTFQKNDVYNVYNGPSLCGTYGNFIWSCSDKIDCSQNITTQLNSCQFKKIAIAPNSASNTAAVTAVTNFLSWTTTYLTLPSTSPFVQFSSEDAFISYISNSRYSIDASIPVYSVALIINSGYPQWSYSIRYNQTFSSEIEDAQSPNTMDPNMDISIKANKQKPKNSIPYLQGYTDLGVLSLTDLFNTYISTQSCRTLNICSNSDTIEIQTLGSVGFPNESIEVSLFWRNIGYVFGLLMILALLYPIANMIRALVQEKETRMKETMMIMALREDVHVLTWILHFMALFVPLAALLTGASRTLFKYSSPIYIFIYYIIFFISATAYSFFISKLFNRALTAAIVGCVIFFLGFFIYNGIDTSGLLTNRTIILAASLHPAAAFTFGTLAFIEYEDAQVGINANTWNSSTLYPFTFQDSLTMMLVDTIYITIVAWYIGNIWPSEYGTHKPWYFIFNPYYYLDWYYSCRGQKTKRNQTTESLKNHSNKGNKRNRIDLSLADSSIEEVPIEPVPPTLQLQVEQNTCVNIKNLHKEFHNSNSTKIAVNNLNLNMYSGQITALLGHNGAGKTTTISMLTGLIEPSHGTAIIEGYNLQDDLISIRKNLGVCPQHDVLFPDLTVEEHLILFASFKGCSGPELYQEVNDMIQAVGLTEKKYARSKSLSGGQKRKLSVGIAFIGGSKVVFLDEPTSGMDPYSRRFTWNVIRQHREGRVIVLTTHFMDEADLLGDRIAIMGDGTLRCCGSSLYLKHIYGLGYTITLEKLQSIHFNSIHMTEIIQSYIHNAKLLTDAGTEISYQLPLENSIDFPSLFHYLDDHDYELGVRSYGISITTLEEVFIKVTSHTHTLQRADHALDKMIQHHSTTTHQLNHSEKNAMEIQDSSSINDNQTRDVESSKSSAAASTFSKISETEYWIHFQRHMYALLLKRALYFTRDRKSWAFQYGVPLLLVLIGLIVQNLRFGVKNPPALKMTPSIYNTDISTNRLPTYYSNNINTPFCYYSKSTNNYQCDLNTLQSSVMNNIPLSSTFPMLPLNTATNISAISNTLYTQASTYEASRIGAYSVAKTLTLPSNASIINNLQYFVHANYTALHAAPLYQTLITQSLLKQMSSTISVTMYLHPLPLTVKESASYDNFNLVLVVIFIMLAMPWLAASYASYVVREREIKSKHQQMVSGVTVYAYWISSWIWDFISYQPTLWGVVILVVSFPNTDNLTAIDTGALGSMIGLLIQFGLAISGFVYCSSFNFKTPSGAQILTVFSLLGLGVGLTSFGVLLRTIPSTKNAFIKYIRPIFLLVPPYALGDGLANLALRDIWAYDELPGGRSYEVNDLNITGLNHIYLGFECLMYLILAIMIEYFLTWQSFESYFQSKNELIVDNSLRDDDVKAEENRVHNGQADSNNSSILIKDLKKKYFKGQYAVKGLSLGIPKGECFGLLGVNGAGKSTTLGILSGEIKPSSGEVYLDHSNLLIDVHTCRRKIGFCPQFDALFDLLSGREHLELYARIKGIVDKDIPHVVEQKLIELGLSEYANQSAGTYSGGNKRKLSVAIAMIGDPSIVYLDEPSSGMDPLARRFMWKVITDIVTKQEKCSLILTTHSMEECEALCTRIGIMVAGVLRCLGSAQRLRSLYGRGYQIEIGMKLPTNEQIQNKVTYIHDLLLPNTTTTEENSYIDKRNLARIFELSGHKEWYDMINEDNNGDTSNHELLSFLPDIPVKYLASWWLLEETYEQVCAFLTSTFNTYEIKERQLSKLRIEISTTTAVTASNVLDGDHTAVYKTTPHSLGSMFGVIEANKDLVGISEYSIAQISLEQIFNQFAATQEKN